MIIHRRCLLPCCGLDTIPEECEETDPALSVGVNEDLTCNMEKTPLEGDIVNCFDNTGINYQGEHSDHGCLHWKDAENVYFKAEFYPELKSNFCRNPGNVRNAPWCLVSIDGIETWKYCSIPHCQPSIPGGVLALKLSIESDVNIYDKYNIEDRHFPIACRFPWNYHGTVQRSCSLLKKEDHHWMATYGGFQNLDKIKICSILGKDRLVDKNTFLVCDTTENIWTAWTDNVSVDCFDGKPVRRERFCINGDCEGQEFSFGNATKSNCKSESDNWSPWALLKCSRSCGGGHWVHTRTCKNEPCEGQKERQTSHVCNTHDCHVTNKVCSKKCGGGTYSIIKNCVGEGPDCKEETIETDEVCNTFDCMSCYNITNVQESLDFSLCIYLFYDNAFKIHIRTPH